MALPIALLPCALGVNAGNRIMPRFRFGHKSEEKKYFNAYYNRQYSQIREERKKLRK